jgi:hypothetical protein
MIWALPLTLLVAVMYATVNWTDTETEMVVVT